jgi:hypothetical protein
MSVHNHSRESLEKDLLDYFDLARFFRRPDLSLCVHRGLDIGVGNDGSNPIHLLLDLFLLLFGEDVLVATSFCDGSILCEPLTDAFNKLNVDRVAFAFEFP